MALLLSRHIAAKLWALWFVVLSALPFTAPFSTFDAADLLSGRDTDNVIGTLAVQTCPTDNDNALTLERWDFIRQSRLCARVVVASLDAAPVLARLAPSVAPISINPNPPALQRILRL
jgi:hypothetical protein